MMRKLRFSIAGLMGFVLVAALGFAGLKGADESWASGCFTLMVVALILAVLTALQSRGRDRAYWMGFALAGWFYFGVIFGAMGKIHVTSPSLLTELLFDRLEPMFHPATAASVTFTFGPTTITPAAPAATPVAAPTPAVPTATPSQVVIANGATPMIAPPSPPMPIALSPGPPWLVMPTTTITLIHYSQVAHSLMALLAGMLGGFYSAWLFARRERREGGPVAEVSPSSP